MIEVHLPYSLGIRPRGQVVLYQLSSDKQTAYLLKSICRIFILLEDVDKKLRGIIRHTHEMKASTRVVSLLPTGRIARTPPHASPAAGCAATAAVMIPLYLSTKFSIP